MRQSPPEKKANHTASRTGTILNATSIARDVGITGPTVRRWLSMLETSQVIHLLPPFHLSFGKRTGKRPKLVLMDPGLATFHLGLHTAEAVLHGPSIGALAETAVINEWIKAARGVLACPVDRPTTLRPGIKAVPWHLAW